MDGLTEAEKRYLRKKNGVKSRFAIDQPTSDKPKKDREYLCPTNILQTMSRRKRRGFNGCKMSPEVRAMVEQQRALNAAFHAELKASLGQRK
jgi:hypothetical protein